MVKWSSAALAILAWWIVSLIVPSNVIPDPWKTTVALVNNAMANELWEHLYVTLLRVIGGLALAMLIGIPIGVWMGLSRRAENWLDVWVTVALSVPSLCYALVCFIWLGLNEFATIVAIAVTAAPSIAINLWEGVKNLDLRLIKMARVFGAPHSVTLRKVVMPQVMPYVMAAVRFGLGVVWKIVILVELIGRPNGVGFKLFYWYQLADMTQVLAWTMLFTLVMIAIEVIVLKPIERKLFSWRPRVEL